MNEVLEQTKQLRGKPDMKPEEIEKHSKLLLDEFLHDGDEKVSSSLFQFINDNKMLYLVLDDFNEQIVIFLFFFLRANGMLFLLQCYKFLPCLLYIYFKRAIQ